MLVSEATEKRVCRSGWSIFHLMEHSVFRRTQSVMMIDTGSVSKLVPHIQDCSQITLHSVTTLQLALEVR